MPSSSLGGERTPAENRGGLGVRPGQFRFQQQAASPSRGSRTGRGALQLVCEESAIQVKRGEPRLGRTLFEEGKPGERRRVRFRDRERLGEPLAEFAPAGSGDPVLASRRAFRRAPSPERDEATAQEAAKSGVDLRDIRAPAESGILGEAHSEVPSARRTASEEPEKDV